MKISIWQSIQSLVNILSPAAGGAVGADNVAVAATPVQLNGAVSKACRSVTFSARDDNAGRVAWGWDNTVRASGARKGAALLQGQSFTVDVSDVSLIWIDAATNGDGVVWTTSA